MPDSWPLNTPPQGYEVVRGSIGVVGCCGRIIDGGGCGSVHSYSRLVSIMSKGLSSRACPTSILGS